MGHDVLVAAMANEGSCLSCENAGYQIHYFPGELPKRGYRNKGMLAKLTWLYSTYKKSGDCLRAMSGHLAGRRPALMILYGRSYLRLAPFIRWASRRGIFVILDQVESNESFAGFGGVLSPVYWDWCLGSMLLPRMVGAISAISTVLAERAKKRGCRRVYLLPSAEDFGQQPPQVVSHEGTFNIVYFGALIARDNPGFLVGLIDELAKRNVNVRFDIAGRYESANESKPYVDRLCAHVSSGRVRLHGEIDDKHLAELLSRADALILSRRDAPAEIAAFPTRLAECLKTAKPVLACSVGDIPLHLKDGVDAILLDPADVTSAATRVAELISSPDRGSAIGLRGYYAGRERFDRLTHARALLSVAANS